ncbi:MULTISPECIES: ABC transporter substrate-binding protein [unclassified Streptomyces]|uniref:ABC transporter substrate-binding protein n=1 Tax=unclassified Streptomyces TaxID=2593676 RepID=UPI00331FA0EE
MTGRPRTTRTSPLPSASPTARSGRRPGRARALALGALAVCAALTAGCGALPSVTGSADPVKIMTWAPQDTGATNKPGMPAMALAYAKWINSQGGIGGRKLQVLTCNDHNNSVDAAKCARRAADEDVVAVVGSYSQFGDSFLAPLESAGIPYIGGYGVTTDEFTGMMSYPVNGGQPALLAGLGRALSGSCGPVSLVRPDSIAGDELPALLDSGLKAGGHPQARDQLVAEDLTAYGTPSDAALRYAAGDALKKGCVVPALGDRTDTFMDSFRRERADYPAVRLGTVLGSVDQTMINATGGSSGPYEGAYVTGWYPPANDARWKRMKQVINEEAFGDNRIDPADAGVQTTWIAYTVLKAVLEKIGGNDVSADSVRKTLDGGLAVSTGGLTPTLRWPYEGRLASVGFPRMVNADVTLQVVQDGELVAARRGVGGIDGTTDMTGTLADADVE